MRERTPSRGNPYENPELLRWLDSYEGLPPILDPAESAEEVARREAWGERAHRLFGMAGAVLPGLALAGALALLGERFAQWLGTSVLGFEKSPVSGILVAILLGLAIPTGSACPRCTRRAFACACGACCAWAWRSSGSA